MPNNFNDNANKKNLNGSDISYTTYRTNYSNDEAMKENGGVPSGGDVKISTNTTTTVDVSTYTEPIEIEPAEGYDATKKVTLTLENISSSGYKLTDTFEITAFAYEDESGEINSTIHVMFVNAQGMFTNDAEQAVGYFWTYYADILHYSDETDIPASWQKIDADTSVHNFLEVANLDRYS